jgi:RNA recognition motif-containing protein
LFDFASGNQTEGEGMKNLFVGNLPFSISESDLRTLFEEYGSVERVSIITDRDTGKSRGFGFVEMADDQAAEKAIGGLNSKEFDGRALSVSEAKPKTEHGGGGGGREGRMGGGSGRGSRPSRGPRY